MSIQEMLKERRKPQPFELAGVTFYLGRISAKDLSEASAAGDGVRQSAEMLSRTVLDADGNRVWASADEAMEADWGLLKPLMDQVQRVNGLDVEDQRGN